MIPRYSTVRYSVCASVCIIPTLTKLNFTAIYKSVVIVLSHEVIDIVSIATCSNYCPINLCTIQSSDRLD